MGKTAKLTKRILTLILSAVLVCGMLPAQAYAAPLSTAPGIEEGSTTASQASAEVSSDEIAEMYGTGDADASAKDDRSGAKDAAVEEGSTTASQASAEVSSDEIAEMSGTGDADASAKDDSAAAENASAKDGVAGAEDADEEDRTAESMLDPGDQVITIHFTTTNVKAIRIGDTEVPAVNNELNITMASGSPIFISEVIPADGYEIQEDYLNLIIRVGDSEIQYDKKSNAWKSGLYTEDQTGTIEVKNPQVWVTINASVLIDDAVSSLTYIETEPGTADDGSPIWMEKGEEKTLTFTDENLYFGYITIDAGNALKVTGWTYSDEEIEEQDRFKGYMGRISLVSAIEMGFHLNDASYEEIATYEVAEDGPIQTDAITLTPDIEYAELVIIGKTMPAARIRLAENVPHLAPTDPYVPEESCFTTICYYYEGGSTEEVAYVNRADFLFTLNAEENYAVRKATYRIGNEAAKDAEKVLNDGKTLWKIPQKEIEYAIRNKKQIVIDAEAGPEKLGVTFRRNKNVTSIKYQEYSVSTDGNGKPVYTTVGSEGTVAYEENAQTATVVVTNGNVLALDITPKQGVENGSNSTDDMILIWDSVQFNGMAIEALPEDTTLAGGAGKYLITPVEPEDDPEANEENGEGVNELTVTPYDPVVIDIWEAFGKNLPSDENDKQFTETAFIEGERKIAGSSMKSITTGGEIVFTSRLNDGLTDYDAVFLPPSVGIGDNSDLTAVMVRPFTDPNTGVTEYRIAKEDVATAVKSGKHIHITSKARAIPRKILTFTVSGEYLKFLKVKEYHSREDYQKGAEPVKVRSFSDTDEGWVKNAEDGTGTITTEFHAGNFVVLSKASIDDGYSTTMSYISFVRVKKDGSVLKYGNCSTSYELGKLTADTAVTVEGAVMPTDRITISAEPASAEYTAGGSVSEYQTVSIHSSNDHLSNLSAAGVICYLTIDPADTTDNYLFTGAVNCSVEGGDKFSVPLKYSGKAWSFVLPFEVVTEAALAGKGITAKASVIRTGYQKQQIRVIQEKDSAKTVIRVNGEAMQKNGRSELDDGDAVEVSYGKKADITVTPAAGYSLYGTCAISKKNADAKKATIREADETLSDAEVNEAFLDWLFNDGEIDGQSVVITGDYGKNKPLSLSIKSVDEYYEVYNSTGSVPTLYVDNEPVEDGAVLKTDHHVTPRLYILDGKTPLTIADDSQWVVSAFTTDESGEPMQENNAFEGHNWDAKQLILRSGELQGKTVTVCIKSEETISTDEEDEIPKYRWTVKFDVNQALTRSDIKFAGENNLDAELINLGNVSTVSIYTPEKDFDFSRVRVLLTGTGANKLNPVLETHDGDVMHFVKFRTSPDQTDLLTSTDLTLYLTDEFWYREKYPALYDPADRAVKTVSQAPDAYISKMPLKVTTEGVEKSDLSEITVTPEPDGFTFDLTKADFSGYWGENNIPEGLYYLINAATTDETEGLVKTVANLPVPANTGQYTLNLAKDEASFEPNAITYDVTIDLIQVSGLGANGSYDPSKLIKASGEVDGKKVHFEKTLTTDPECTFPTSLKFRKDKYLPKKLYNTMDEIYIGTVSCGEISRGVYPTVQRLKKVEVQTTGGRVLYSTENQADRDVIRYENGSIYLTPSAAGAGADEQHPDLIGKIRIVAYAAEQNGGDITCSQTLTLNQGISNIMLQAPDKIYKAPGKKASVKVKAAIYPVTKPLPSKKLKWSFVESVEYNSYTLEIKSMGDPVSYGKNITIKNGTITIAKNYVIPEEGLTLYVCATAADYAGRTLKYAVPVKVHAQTQVPSYLTIDGNMIENGSEYYSNEVNGAIVFLDAEMQSMDASYTLKNLAARKNADGSVYGADANKITNKASVKAKSTDGTNKTKTVEFTIKSDEDLKFDLLDASGESILKKTEEGYTATNGYPAGQYMTLYVTGAHDAMISHSLKQAGAKKISSGLIYDPETHEYYPGTAYKLNPTARETVLTITDKTKNNEETVIRITNKLFAPKSVKTTVAASNPYRTWNAKKKKLITKDNGGKIFNTLYFDSAEAYENAGSINRVTYTVKKGGKPVNGGVVLYTKDDAMRGIISKHISSGALAGTVIGNIPGKFVVYTDANGKFTIDYAGYDTEAADPEDPRIADGESLFDIPEGTYSFTVTPVDEEASGIADTAVVKVKASSAPKAKVTMAKTQFKNFGSQDTIGFKTMDNILFIGNVSSAAFTGNERGVNVKGHINRFRTVFATTAATGGVDGKLTCIRAPKDYDDAYTGKSSNGMSGYVEYSWTNLDGSYGSAWAKVTVKPKKKKHIEQFVLEP
ncbi:MAG: hypothetical protein K6F53_09695 [Lachnospiraceae bacterium]|nr:hypothetical protein [Lachnospiraceae bacterium]